MKVALRILLWYLPVSLLATSLSLTLQPLHAHIPALVILGFFPIHPALWVRDAVQGNLSPSNALCLCLVVASMGMVVWHSLRHRAEPAV
jgi:hypothetical protein